MLNNQSITLVCQSVRLYDKIQHFKEEIKTTPKRIHTVHKLSSLILWGAIVFFMPAHIHTRHTLY